MNTETNNENAKEDVETLIGNAKKDLETTDKKINTTANQKGILAIVIAIISIILIGVAIYYYSQTLANNLKNNRNYLLIYSSLDIKRQELNIKEGKLIKLKKKCQDAIDSVNREASIRNSRTNNRSFGLTTVGKIEGISVRYQEILKEKQKKCSDKDEQEDKIKKNEDEILKLITILSNMKSGITPVYILLFIGATLLLVSIFSFISFTRSRQKSLSVRLMINQYHTFHLAALQCDKLKADEVDPEKLINSIIKKIPVYVFDARHQKKNSELYTLLGKLKVPQRKSVEARAELIKVISNYHENNH